MGRPRLYHTPDEKAKARKLKDEQYYENTPHKTPSPSQDILDQLELMDKSLSDLTAQPSFYSSVCDESIRVESLQPIEDKLSLIEDIFQPSHELMATLLQVDGIGSRWKHAEAIHQRFQDVICRLDDILCYGMEGIQVLSSMYSSALNAPIKREEMNIRPLTRAETRFLREWVPEYCIAKGEGSTQTEVFLNRFWLMWFDRFPLEFPEALEDPDLTEWRRGKRKEVRRLVRIRGQGAYECITGQRVLETLYWLNLTMKRTRETSAGETQREGCAICRAMGGEHSTLSSPSVSVSMGKRRRVHNAIDDDDTFCIDEQHSRQLKVSASRRYFICTPRSPKKKTVVPALVPLEPQSTSWTPNEDVEAWDADAIEELVNDTIDPALVKKRSNTSDDPLREWIPYREEFVWESIRAEAQSEAAHAGECATCRDKLENEQAMERATTPLREMGDPLYHCLECFGFRNECLDCCMERHKNLPLHWIEQGFSVRLLSESRKTYDSSRVEIPKYRHERLMKRAGRGNIENGIATTSPGDLALICAACPQPGINLPEGWERVPPALRPQDETEKDVKLQLIEMENEAAPPAQRHRLKAQASERDLTSTQAAKVEEARLAFHRQLKQFRALQAVYMLLALALVDIQVDERPEDFDLYFPSSLDAEERNRTCTRGLATKEDKLREAQCHDSLDRIRLLQ
ncbi:CxC2 domain-containing protein [Salix suchowensis]|nr:CxC2 domain-containing protein [Salix suchowensis]